MKRKKRLKPIEIVLIIVILALGYYYTGKDYKPFFEYSENVKQIEKECEESILSVEQGFYSKKIPIFANEIEIIESEKDRILYKVSYFPFGSIERSYTKSDQGEWIFNLEKSLCGL